MVDILQDFPIRKPPSVVYEGVSAPAMLDQWWSLRSSGAPKVGAEYELDFGPEYVWRAVVTRASPPEAFELRMIGADKDWLGTVVGFTLSPSKSGTWVEFRHTGWPEANEHFRTSAHCWALYLRILRRHLEFGETVPYDRRLEV